MYVEPNFKTKKALRDAVTAGDTVTVFSPGLSPAPTDGATSIEGPHYPEPHKWYARVEISEGRVTKVLK